MTPTPAVVSRTTTMWGKRLEHSFRLTVGSPERTLSSDEIAAIRAAIIERMRDLGYELRV